MNLVFLISFIGIGGNHPHSSNVGITNSCSCESNSTCNTVLHAVIPAAVYLSYQYNLVIPI